MLSLVAALALISAPQQSPQSPNVADLRRQLREAEYSNQDTGRRYRHAVADLASRASSQIVKRLPWGWYVVGVDGVRSINGDSVSMTVKVRGLSTTVKQIWTVKTEADFADLVTETASIVCAMDAALAGVPVPAPRARWTAAEDVILEGPPQQTLPCDPPADGGLIGVPGCGRAACNARLGLLRRKGLSLTV